MLRIGKGERVKEGMVKGEGKLGPIERGICGRRGEGKEW